ncbi:type II toxin-antitoxin system VapC family toxin [Pseudomonas sp. HR96]|uniref:type II toxin-antitoxin system VapC family toxin n=1 Tax=Pseudomonas sp. HR96 TaxID=1027966 RepID=UPI002A74A179|nr:type II toxin-antitoxin system VapC family toxin [Pseudomonas sp. HR96]WPO98441.1 type II toxin-antitoxin system VapC family toxin [Pseudomonas sp. HR96]
MYLLDTNVVSELRKARSAKADPGVVEWAQGVAAGDLFISAVTLLELETGVLRIQRKDASQGAILRTWIDQHVLPVFAGRVLAIDSAVALRCARLHIPDPRQETDALIAATALLHGMTVVTRNIRDFQHMGVPLLNPWRA